MENRTTAGAAWAARLMLILSAAALCNLFVSIPAGAQQSDDPSISIDGLQENFCPGLSTLTVFYLAQAQNGVGLINVNAKSDTTGAELSSDLVFDGDVKTFADSAVLDFTDQPDSSWTITATVFDTKNQKATAVRSVDVVQKLSCEGPAPTVALGNVELSGKVCPDPVKLSVPYTAEAGAGVRQVRVEVNLVNSTTSTVIGETTKVDGVETKFSKTAVFDIPAETPSSTWTVKVTATDANGATAQAVTTVDLVANPGCADDGAPTLAIQDVKAAGPLCPAGTTVNANLVLDNVDGPVTLTGTIEGPDGYSLKGDPVTITADGTRQTVPWSIALPVDAPDGKLVFDVMAEATTWSTMTATTFMVDRDAEACVGDSGVAVTIDTLQVCPAAKTVTAVVSASADEGLKTMVVRSDLFDSPQSVPLVEGTKSLKKSVIFAIPSSAKPGTYQLVAEVTDTTGNTSLAYQDFTLGSVDDCGITPTATPVPPATPTPTPGVQIPATPTPTPGVQIPATPTPTPGNPNKPKPATPTPTLTPNPGGLSGQGGGGKPGGLAYTGRNSVALALGGLTLVATGLAVAWDPRSRSFGRRR